MARSSKCIPIRSRTTTRRPTFKSDAGRVVVGGGGIRPDIVVADDTLSTIERDFLRASAPQGQAINTVLQDYALELKGTVADGLHGAAERGRRSVMRRLDAANVKIEPKYDSAARAVPDARSREPRGAHRVRRRGGQGARCSAEDHQLARAIELLEHSTTQAQLLAASRHDAPLAA